MNQEKNQAPNRRRYARRAAFIIAEYTAKEGVFRDIVKSIGAHGIFISTPREIAPGQEIVLKFPLFKFEHLIQITGKVVRSTAKGFAVDFEQPIEALICKEGQFPNIVHEIDRNGE